MYFKESGHSFFQSISKRKVQTAFVFIPILIVCILLYQNSFARSLVRALASGSWHENPYYDHAATIKPKPEAVVGNYILTKQELTNEGLEFLQGQQSIIEIRSNGTYTITNLPLWKRDATAKSNYRFEELISTTGHWDISVAGLSKNKEIWGLGLEYDSSQLPSTLKEVIITNNAPPHGLFFDLDDPDSMAVMFYERIKSAAPDNPR